MTRLILQVLFLMIVLTSCRSGSNAWVLKTQSCKDLFRYEPLPSGYDEDSMRPPIHIPPEAKNAIGQGYYPNREAELTQQYALSCLPDLKILSTETLEEGPASDDGDALLSPSSRLLAMDICCDEDARIEIIDLTTGSRRQVSDHSKGYESVMFWGSESERFLRVEDPDQYAAHLVERLDIVTGERIRYTELQHYEGLESQRAAGQFYTGWQAVELLSVDMEDICIAAHDDLLTATYAADGTRLIKRDDLLKEATTIVTRHDPTYVARESIIEMMNLATNIRAVRSDSGYWLIMDGLPRPNRQVVISTTDETLVTNIPLVKNGVNVLWNGGVRSPDAHPLFFIAPNLCQPRGWYQYVLYRKREDGTLPVALGILPYPYSQYSVAANATWSPDGKYIYIDQWSGGRYSISRLDLTDYMVEE